MPESKGEKATERHRIRIKIGEDEFDAEGPADIVRQQYEQFLLALHDEVDPVATDETRGANARLIARAPELLAAVKQRDEEIEALRARVAELEKSYCFVPPPPAEPEGER